MMAQKRTLETLVPTTRSFTIIDQMIITTLHREESLYIKTVNGRLLVQMVVFGLQKEIMIL